MLFGIVISVLAACGTICHGAALYDIIPRPWITGDGRSDRRDASPAPDALIFPSTPGDSSQTVDFSADHFLGKSNRVPARNLSFPLPSYAQRSSPSNLAIDLERTDKTSPRLRLRARAKTLYAIRALDWDEFRRLQGDFAAFLLRLSGPAYPFSHPVCRFDDFEGTLRTFWLECLREASFQDFQQRHLTALPRRIPNEHRRPDGTIAPDDEDVGGDYGVKMGAIPLQPGMRLAIHWGGTTFLNYGANGVTNVTRQTSAGTTLLPLVRRGGALVPGPLNNWRLTTTFPTQEKTTATSSGLPFGKGAAGNFEGKVIPIYNEHDLHHLNALLVPNDTAGAAKAARNLTLLIPYKYTKADSGKGDAKQFTNDALADVATEEEVLESLSRRFILWGSQAAYTGTLRPDFTRTGVQRWISPAMVFGNQSWVDVECGISINQTVEWVPIGFTLGDFLEAHARWALDRNPTPQRADCLVRLRRATKARDDRTGYDVREFRFWGLPAKFAALTELHPGDSIELKP